MMLEDTLIYNPPTTRTFAALLQADLEADGLEFYLQMSGDIGTVAADRNQPAEGDRLAELLLNALLVAGPAARRDAWRQFYRGVRTLVAGFAPDEHAPEFRRLRQFVRENADLADTLATADLRSTPLLYAG